MPLRPSFLVLAVNLSRLGRLIVLDMKRFLLAIPACLLVSSAMSGATDVSGKWAGFPVYLTLKQDGNTVTGSAGESEDDQIPFQSGSIEDDRLTLKLGAMEINLVVQGDQMSGEVHQGTRTMKMVFRRLKPRDPSTPPPSFDAASVKRSPPQPSGKGGGSNMKADPGRLTCTNVPLKRYLIAAWSLKDYQISAPDWNERRALRCDGNHARRHSSTRGPAYASDASRRSLQACHSPGNERPGRLCARPG